MIITFPGTRAGITRRTFKLKDIRDFKRFPLKFSKGEILSLAEGHPFATEPLSEPLHKGRQRNGYYYHPTTYNYGSAQTFQVSTQIYAYSYFWNPLLKVWKLRGNRLDREDLRLSGAEMQTRTSSDGIVWSAWSRITQAQFTTQYVEFRLRLFNEEETLKRQKLKNSHLKTMGVADWGVLVRGYDIQFNFLEREERGVAVFVPEISWLDLPLIGSKLSIMGADEGIKNLLWKNCLLKTAGIGRTIFFNTFFTENPSVQVSIDQAGPGEYVYLAGVSKRCFTIAIRRSTYAGQPVWDPDYFKRSRRSVNWIAQGK